MESETLKLIRKDLQTLKKDMKELKTFIKEDYPVSDTIIKEVEESQKGGKKRLISSEEMEKEFG